ncbi:hypothetical protein AMTRI_Chr10g226050 [Amborella trichopoda]|uniref:Presenilin n=1 Tax=Amborella trichopoda TaxID=13333 RepID=W1PC62_AMBTC|nr:presenilin-like protein At2g29900 [Amborella trichopoda]ERN07517.1 hypothetical protein AMTR_s00154p00031240 [Amborella trichopoda]|eukprot:XP_006845842.1 presenilin-like protein At2g29900 [Amborella trichopoda]
MENPSQRTRASIIDGLGEEIIRIVTPVSICMFLVVLLVCIINPSSSSDDSSSITTIATIIYDEKTSDSDWTKLTGALLNALVFVAFVTVVTFLLVLLFYCRCIKFLKYYMVFSAFVVLFFMGGGISLFLIQTLSFPIDCITFGVLWFNFSIVGVLSFSMEKNPIFITQSYLVFIGIIVAYWFCLLPEWTTWVLLIAMAVYDLFAVLVPGGPLRLLVELSVSRDEEIPALLYEARPVEFPGPDQVNGRRRLWREREILGSGSDSGSTSNGLGSALGNLVASSDHGVNILNLQSHMGTESQRETKLVVAEETQLIGGSGSSIKSTLGKLLALENRRANVSELNLGSEPEMDLSLISVEDGRSTGDSVTETGSPTIQDSSSRYLETMETHVEFTGNSVTEIGSEESRPLIDRRIGFSSNRGSETMEIHVERRPNLTEVQQNEAMEIGSSRGIKLGLGDFIFYSVLVGRAAMYDFMAMYACYLAIIAGLGVTLMLLAFYQKALPALPVSILLGIVFYFLTRLLLEGFVVQCSLNLIIF